MEMFGLLIIHLKICMDTDLFPVLHGKNRLNTLKCCLHRTLLAWIFTCGSTLMSDYSMWLDTLYNWT